MQAIQHENLPLIEVSEASLLDAILKDARAAQCILTRLSDRVAVVTPNRLDELLARLRKLGHMPKVTG